MRWILLIVIVAGCGDTFESELFLEGQDDSGTSDSGPTSVDASVSDSSSDTWGDTANRGTSDSSVTDLGDSSPIETGNSGDGDAGDASTTEAGVIPCPSPQCDAYCESLDKVVQCYEGVNVCYCWPL